ncbi:hypothetical protein L1887_52881 [Cichorium endivia]|nr:hypothetical protein L1887_52881 [Cichorium endivia]
MRVGKADVVVGGHVARRHAVDKARLLVELDVVEHLERQRVVAEEHVDAQQADDGEVAEHAVRGAWSRTRRPPRPAPSTAPHAAVLEQGDLVVGLVGGAVPPLGEALELVDELVDNVPEPLRGELELDGPVAVENKVEKVAVVVVGVEAVLAVGAQARVDVAGTRARGSLVGVADVLHVVVLDGLVEENNVLSDLVGHGGESGGLSLLLSLGVGGSKSGSLSLVDLSASLAGERAGRVVANDEVYVVTELLLIAKLLLSAEELTLLLLLLLLLGLESSAGGLALAGMGRQPCCADVCVCRCSAPFAVQRELCFVNEMVVGERKQPGKSRALLPVSHFATPRAVASRPGSAGWAQHARCAQSFTLRWAVPSEAGWLAGGLFQEREHFSSSCRVLPGRRVQNLQFSQRAHPQANFQIAGAGPIENLRRLNREAGRDLGAALVRKSQDAPAQLHSLREGTLRCQLVLTRNVGRHMLDSSNGSWFMVAAFPLCSEYEGATDAVDHPRDPSSTRSIQSDRGPTRGSSSCDGGRGVRTAGDARAPAGSPCWHNSTARRARRPAQPSGWPRRYVCGPAAPRPDARCGAVGSAPGFVVYAACAGCAARDVVMPAWRRMTWVEAMVLESLL